MDAGHQLRWPLPLSQPGVFPMGDDHANWTRLAKNLKAEIDEGLMDAYHGVVSLPFEKGDQKCVAAKIVDDRGIESLRIMPLFK